MMNEDANALSALYHSGVPAISFELFPPKTKDGDAPLMEQVEALMRHNPRFITCTYGAGGSTRDRTLEIVREVKRRFHVPVASHLTCVGADVTYLRRYLQSAERDGVDYVVALRGDPPRGETTFVPAANGFTYAYQLVTLIRQEFPSFGIAVAGYPEVHQEASSATADLMHLKDKVACGADVVITQLFYRNQDYFDFCQRARSVGISVPIVPGILPVTSLQQIQRISSLCKATLPPVFVDRLSQRNDADWQFHVGVEYASQQVKELLQHGVPGIHFYVLNKSQATSHVLDQVGRNLSSS